MRTKNNLKHLLQTIDKLTMPSRIIIVFSCVGVLVGIIIFSLAKYTLFDHTFYKTLADRQQLRTQELSVNRGNIYGGVDPLRVTSDLGMHPILATTNITQNLSIDPGGLCNLNLLEDFLVDVVYQHLCSNREAESCTDNVMKYTNVYELPENFSIQKDFVSDFIRPVIHEQTHRIYKTSIEIMTWILGSDMNTLIALNNPGVKIIGDGVYLDPTLFDKQNGVETLLNITKITPEQLEDALTLRPNRNVDIIESMGNDLSILIQNRIYDEISGFKLQDLPILQDQEEYLKNSTIYKCLKLEDNPVREYPEWDSMAQIIGFVNRDGDGQLGIEGYFNALLAGQAGQKEERRDSQWRPIFNKDEQSAIKWVDLYLTIDPNIQKNMMDILEQGVRATGANNASAVIMDPSTGAIRAMWSWPTFDPNRPGNADAIKRFYPEEYNSPILYLLGKVLFVESETWKVKKIYQNRYISVDELHEEDDMVKALENPDNVLYIYENNVGLIAHQNIAVSLPYEPGSIFKWLTTAIGLDTGEIESDTMYEDTWSVKVDEFTISNLVNSACQGWHSYRNALNYSCNVGMISIVRKLWRPLFYSYLKKFGFWDITGITLDGEHTGILEAYEKWYNARLFTMSFGQGIQVNLVQMASAYSTLANWWVLMQPYIVDKKVYPDGDTVTTEPIPLRRVISQESSQKITAMLTDSTKQGFAKSGAVDGYTLAWKTWTSQIASSKWWFEAGTNGRTNTSYAGYGPSNNPRFVIIVRFDRPRSTQLAEQSSAKSFHDIAAYLLQYYNIPPEQ